MRRNSLTKSEYRKIQGIIVYVIISLCVAGVTFFVIGLAINIQWILTVSELLFLVGYFLGLTEAVLGVLRKKAPGYVDYKWTCDANPEHTKPVVNDLIKRFDDLIRLNFTNLPMNEFKLKNELFNQLNKECQNGCPSTSIIQKILIEMEHFLGIDGANRSIIIMAKIDDKRAGYIEKRDFDMNEITIGYNDIYGPYNYLAVIAHEVSHAYQFFCRKGNLFSDVSEEEKFTDALTFYLGFGDYTERGKIAKKVTSEFVGTNTSRTTRTCTLGYLDKSFFPDLFYCSGKLISDRKQNEIERTENDKLIKEIDSLLPSFKLYLNSCYSKIEELKNCPLTEEQFEVIKGFYSIFRECSYQELLNLCSDYRKSSLKANRVLVERVKKEMALLFDYYYKISLISNNKSRNN